MNYEIAKFLKANGFKPLTPDVYQNDKCHVSYSRDGYDVWFNDYTWHLHEHNIYQLVGFLTWNDLMDKNYIQL